MPTVSAERDDLLCWWYKRWTEK